MNIKWLNKDKNKYVVIFAVKEGNSYNFMKSKIIKPTIKTIKYDKENEFIIDIENHTYRKGNIRFYCIDINSKQIYFEDKEKKEIIKDGKIKLEQLKESEFISSRITKRIMSDEIILQLAKATTTPIKQTYDWKALIIGLIIGALGGALTILAIIFFSGV